MNSLLNSHPGLKTYGEIVDNKLRRFQDLQKNEGAICHYNQFVDLPDKQLIKQAKIIHLIRNDLEKVARSMIISGMWKERLGTYRHYKRNTTIEHPPLPRDRVEKAKMATKEHRRRAMEYLWDVDMFHLSYEMLTCDDNLETLSKKRATPILEFLGVEPMKLTTNFKKPKYAVQ